MTFDTQNDFLPILLVADVPNILVVNNDLPARIRRVRPLRQGQSGKLNSLDRHRQLDAPGG